ncbi:unnamed protein product [Protopolystoma xenopodis]|uniref:Uncharacterized protein n=1 Tax=Protopolystoma xenopodis TaxID=117903 RepID=A0A3S5A8N5_9PLAT|nr:unnamed protein product [Protopolystoma xenopodis]
MHQHGDTRGDFLLVAVRHHPTHPHATDNCTNGRYRLSSFFRPLVVRPFEATCCKPTSSPQTPSCFEQSFEPTDKQIRLHELPINSTNKK